jgi:hypothetical protein
VDPIISPTLTLLSSILDLSYSPNSYSTGNNTLRRDSYHNIDNFDQEILETELGASPRKLTDIIVIDLMGNVPLIPNSLICSSIEGDSDSDNWGLPTHYNQAKPEEDAQTISKEPSIKL